MSVILAKRALPKSLGGAPPPEVAAALAQLPNSFGQLALASGEASLNIKALKRQPGLYRLRVGDWRAVFVKIAEGFLVAAIGLRKDIYERVSRMRIARKGEGLRVVEVGPPAVEASDASRHARVRARARPPKAVEQNPLTPFSDAELRRFDGVDDRLVTFLRPLPPSIDIGDALSARVGDPDLVVLLTDLREQPWHLEAFRLSTTCISLN